MLAARGTSDNAAQFGRYLLEITTGIPVTLAAPSIFTLYKAPFRFDGVLVVAISQSGESTDTNLVLERAREQGARTIGITNEAGSTLARIAEHVFLVHAGREQSVAATKTYTGSCSCCICSPMRSARTSRWTIWRGCRSGPAARSSSNPKSRAAPSATASWTTPW